METEQLRTLIEVVDSGSFEAAAQALQITPSAVSQRIRALEVQLGRTVVVRGRPVTPTESGEVAIRLARQIALLQADALTELGAESGGPHKISLVINADSLATWALPALAEVARTHRVEFEVRREDQDHSTRALRDGSAMAAVTSVAEPVPGCSVRRLGAMRYRPMATPEFVARWFPDGATPETLTAAPVVQFDRVDDLQLRWLRGQGVADNPPAHYVPESASYAMAVRLGLGWGMIPDLQTTDDLIELQPGGSIDVPLYWQQWRLESPVLTALAEALTDACSGSRAG